MLKRLSPLYLLIALSLVVYVVVLAGVLGEPLDQTFTNDASLHNQAAISLVQHGTYSLDGSTVYAEREPGYPFFMALVYAVFGMQNRVALFGLQILLYLTAVYLFTTSLKRISNTYVAHISAAFLLFSPAIIQIQLSALREGITLTLLLLLLDLLLQAQQSPNRFQVAAMSIILGLLPLIYIPLLFLPLLILAYWVWQKYPWQYLVIGAVVPALLAGAWGMRNKVQLGEFNLSASNRAAMIWYVRGEQAEQLRGLEPFWCLWAEYISRDWSDRSPVCSLNGVIVERWPDRNLGDTASEVTAAAHQKIFQYFPHYLWFSLFEVIEFHVPFVNGWGKLYNRLETLATFFLYLGFIGLPFAKWRREYLLFVVIGLYAIGIFVLTDATPRYRLPTFFCYTALAAVGYNALWCYFGTRWKK